MAITIGSSPAFKPLRLSMVSDTGDSMGRVILLDGAVSDANVISILTSLDNISNAAFTGKFDGRLISGQKADPVTALQNRITEFMSLNFTATDSVSGKQVDRSFVVPAYKNELVDTDFTPIVGTPGTGSASEYLGNLIAKLEEALVYQKADQSWASGMTYVSGGFGSGSGVVDGI